MHLVSTRIQHIRVDDAQIELTMDEGDSIWTESSVQVTAPARLWRARAEWLRAAEAMGRRHGALRAHARQAK